MTIDRARNSFDASRGWRSVLAQQGRVTLEADVNEQARILTESQRLETLDVIGPIGTPDDGYTVSVAAGGGDIEVAPGVIYVGGWRLTSPDPADPVATAQQSGWLDMPPWPAPAGNQIVALLATEQTVVAVEDEALREVALGGPDSAGRLCLLQHLLRIPTAAGGCADAATDLPGLVSALGMTWDPATCALAGAATLQVSVVAAATTPGPCDPPAQGGYLGADNQMIRVAVTDFDTVSGQGHLVWSWNNASFLYRANVAQANVVTFLAAPLDPDHTPSSGQAVELLRCTVDLGDGDRSYLGGGNVIAAASGEVMVLGAAPWAAALKQLTLPSPVGFNDAPLPLFVRLWEAQIPFAAGQPTPLGDTGLQVTIAGLADPAATDPVWGRPFWQFAVRPSTPAMVYPQAFLTSPQPPTGPRQYLAPLGVVAWEDGAFGLIESCGVPFLPLTKLHDCSCCNLVLDPDKDWVTTLTQAAADQNVTAINVCFQPGQFQVASTIIITGKTVRMTGAGGGTVLIGANLEVVLQFDDCPSLDISDFGVTAGLAGWNNSPYTAGLQGAITIRACAQADLARLTLQCADADIRSASCLAVYNPVPPAGAAPQQYNLRITDSQFRVGHCQVGILVVNADRAQITGNLVVTPPAPLNVTIETLPQRPFIAQRLRRQLVQGLTILDTAPPTTAKGKARLRRRQAAGRVPPAQTAAASPTTAEPAPPAAPTPTDPVQAQAPAAVRPTGAAIVPPRINLGALGLAHVRTMVGSLQVQFVSSAKLGSAWNDALRASLPAARANMGAVHRTIKAIADTAVFDTRKTSAAFRNYVAAQLPALYSTSAQGIVVGGNLANDVRIEGNTIDGTVQGIHIGLGDIKKYGYSIAHLSATRVQVRGNTVNIRLTPETVGDRHGIFVGCVNSAVIVENHVQLTPTAGGDGGAGSTKPITAIKVAGFFGPLVLIERNCMLGFTTGVDFVHGNAPSNVLWSVNENISV